MTAPMDDLIGNVTDTTIDEYVGSPAAVVVFGIANCEGCVFMDGVLADLAPRFNGRVKFGKAKMHVPGACREIKKRSEEHTSELQSQSNLVCRLLLEKKKQTDDGLAPCNQ